MSDLAEQKNETPDEQELSGEIVRDSKGRFIKGYSGNPAGNTKNRGIEQLVQAIKKVEEKHGIDYFEEIVERSRTDSVLSLNNMNLMRQPIQHRTGQSLRATHLRPTLERQVRRNNQTLTLISPADDLKQQFRTSFAERHIPQFIKDQQVLFFKLVQQSLQLTIFPGFQQLCHQSCTAEESNFIALTACGKAQCGSQVCLTRSAVAY